MTSEATCQRCSIRAGTPYKFYYGKQLSRSVNAGMEQNTLLTTTVYQVSGEREVRLCDPCIAKLSLWRFGLWAIAGLVLSGMSIIIILSVFFRPTPLPGSFIVAAVVASLSVCCFAIWLFVGLITIEAIESKAERGDNAAAQFSLDFDKELKGKGYIYLTSRGYHLLNSRQKMT